MTQDSYDPPAVGTEPEGITNPTLPKCPECQGDLHIIRHSGYVWAVCVGNEEALYVEDGDPQPCGYSEELGALD